MTEIRAWLKAQSHTSAERRPSGSQILTPETMKEIEKRVIEYYANKSDKTIDITVNPSSIYIVSDLLRNNFIALIFQLFYYFHYF